jgi:tRNA pseudouridine38-40 synthase
VTGSIRNIKMVVAYDGTNFAGWQRQRNLPTIQQILEEAIGIMVREQVNLQGAGRTDAGVHALGMVANFSTSAGIPCTGFLLGLNSMLPSDIRIRAVADAEPGFHARKSAKAKTYVYNICTEPVQCPTKRLYSAHIPYNLDVEAINACLASLIGTHDFSSFEAVGSRDRSNENGRGAVRQIFEARASRSNGGDTVIITVTGDGFLRHMVRNIVGTVAEGGKGRMTVAEFQRILATRDRKHAGPTAPAHGLFLKEVYYREPDC